MYTHLQTGCSELASLPVHLVEPPYEPQRSASAREAERLPAAAERLPAAAERLHDEAGRLRALHALRILDTPAEPEFDELVTLAAAICGSPVSLISMLDEHRQWFKAAIGYPAVETPRDVALCHYAIQQPDLLIVRDTTEDTRFADNPLVTTEGWRFYAGMPVQDGKGYAMGTLCILDKVPRSLTPEQTSALRILANQVSARLELRAKRLALEEAVTAAESARAKAETLERRFQTFMDSGPFVAFMKDSESRILYCNELLARKTGVPREAMLNRNNEELWPPHIAAPYRQHDLETLQSGKLQVYMEDIRNADGSTSIWRSYKFPCPDDSGTTLLGCVSVEVTDELCREAELKRSKEELETANQRLRELVSLDALTGLANRREFDEQIRIAFRRARKENTPLSVLMIDVDHFKSHNDRFGHAHGDEVLRLLGTLLKQELRAGDPVARYGGEEFVVLLEDASALQAQTSAERVLRLVRDTPWPRASLTISIGISTLLPSTRDPKHLVGRADEALYAAKCAGRDRAVSYADILTA